jgi:DNA-binding FadR family transcriptional regulator
VPGNIQLILKQHKKIMKTIKNRDPDGAYQAMHKHIEFVKEFFKSREQ